VGYFEQFHNFLFFIFILRKHYVELGSEKLES